ncbi:replicative DNA helicase [Candidatus Woesebacteria bacterium]|jgi:replicative DNA helicase|nr:replicative DNA helicase [Candidatus Woesebacteria bacterium]
MSNTKLPPHDEMAEKAVLGGVLIDTAAIGDVAEVLQPKHFYFETHRLIYFAILALFEKNQPIDVVTVSTQMKADGNLKGIGGTDYIASLIDAVPTSAYVRKYAEIVKNTYIKRTLITVASELVEESFDDTGEVQELLNKAESEIFALSQAFLHRDFVSLREILAESFERLEKVMKNGGKTRGIPTGFNSLDKKLAGFHDSNLIILAARPGVGKTTFAMNMAMHMAVKEKVAVGFFSLEMSKEELVDRLLVGQADIDAWKLKTGKLDDDDYSRLTQAMGELSEAPIYIDDTPGASVLEMRTKARKMKIEHDLKLIIIDYLQLAVPGKKFESRVQEVGYISQNLKNIARELKIPVIALSQLSRAIEHRGEKRPQLADLRESGCLVGSTLITMADTGLQVQLQDLLGKDNFNVWSMDEKYRLVKKPVSKVFSTGKKPVFTMKLRSGKSIIATGNHKFRTINEWKRLEALKVGDRIATAVMEDEKSVFWDDIVSIEPSGIEEVYDMTVPGTHNFVANDIIPHNSIEQDADVVMFLYGNDEADELVDSSKRMVKLLIAKHRNGATGEIDLMFRGDRVRFYDVDTAVD